MLAQEFTQINNEIFQPKILLFIVQMNEKPPQESQSPSQKHSVPYRNDIDGLRALSVMMVLIFHYWEELLPSGYIGVTIFFVISGYLISSILFKDYIKDEFSFKKFYERRIRRIFPSLQIFLIAALIFILVKYRHFTEEGMKKLHFHAATIIASALMGNNLLLMLQQKRQETVLPHLWSLGVEEQFYLIWPVLAGLIIARKNMRDGIVIISILITVSFGIRCYLDVKFQQFFIPRMFCLGRFWQLFFGCLLAYVEKKVSQNSKQNGNNQQQIESIGVVQQNQTSNCSETLKLNSLLTMGAFFIIIALAFSSLSSRDLYAKFILVITAIAACVMIACPNQGVVTKYVFENKALVYIGKISYDLYLWHYFFVLAFVDLGDLRSKITFLTLSLIVSVLTYEFNQRNVRRNPHPWTVSIILLLMFVILIAGIVFFCLTLENTIPAENHHFLSLRAYQ